MKKNEFPIDGQEAEIKYKITNLKGEILDQTVGRQSFKFIVGDTQTIMKCVSDAVMTMKHDEKKTIEKKKPAVQKTDTAGSKSIDDEPEKNVPVELRISQVVPNQNQPRTEFNEEALEELADSIIKQIKVERKRMEDKKKRDGKDSAD